MWFCPMPRCARREGASPTRWSCLQSLVSHLRSVHLSTGAAPPDEWLDAHGLRVCLKNREITPKGARCPGPRCSTAVLAALALGNTAPLPAQVRSPLAGPLPAGPDLVHLLDFQAAQGTHHVILHLRPCTYLPAAGPGTGADMGHPGTPSPIPPHRPRSSRTGRQGDEVLFDPEMPVAWRRLWTYWWN